MSGGDVSALLLVVLVVAGTVLGVIDLIWPTALYPSERRRLRAANIERLEQELGIGDPAPILPDTLGETGSRSEREAP